MQLPESDPSQDDPAPPIAPPAAAMTVVVNITVTWLGQAEAPPSGGVTPPVPLGGVPAMVLRVEGVSAAEMDELEAG